MTYRPQPSRLTFAAAAALLLGALGALPALAQGVRTRKAPPVLVRLKLGKATLLAGQALNRIDTLAGSGGRREFRWLVLAPAGVKEITLEASTPKAGAASRAIELP